MTNAAERIRARIAVLKSMVVYESDFNDRQIRIEALEDALAECEAQDLDDLAESMSGTDMMPITSPQTHE